MVYGVWCIPMCCWNCVLARYVTLHLTPCTLHHAPCTMHHAPCTMQHAQCNMHPPHLLLSAQLVRICLITSTHASTYHFPQHEYAMHLRPTHHTPCTTPPYTMHNTPYLHHTPYTIQHTPYPILHTPYTIHHTPSSIHHTPIVNGMAQCWIISLNAIYHLTTSIT